MNSVQKLIKIGAIVLAGFIIFNIFSLIIGGITLLFGTYFLFDDNEEVYNFSKVYTEDIKALEIDGINTNVEIIGGNEFKVVAEGLENDFSSKVKNGVLKIEEKEQWFNKINSTGTIYITVPSDVLLDELSIDMGAGKFKINDIKVLDFEIDNGAGILEIDEVDFSNADIDGGAGKIKINNSVLKNLDLDAGAGKVEINADILGNSMINCGVGEVDIMLKGNESEYEIFIEKGLGNIEIDGERQENSVVYGRGVNKLSIEGGIGNIFVSFGK